MLFLTLDGENFTIEKFYDPEDKIGEAAAESSIIFFMQIPVCKKD